jgi:hypothetical protein
MDGVDLSDNYSRLASFDVPLTLLARADEVIE